MCKALEDLYADGVEKGIEQGIEKGIEQGIEQGRSLGIINRNRELILKNHLSGIPDETIAEFLEMSVDFVKQIILEGSAELSKFAPVKTE